MELCTWGSLDRLHLPLRFGDLLRILLSLLDALAHAVRGEEVDRGKLSRKR